jgi:transcriptional accessory protein Tex/SPT6
MGGRSAISETLTRLRQPPQAWCRHTARNGSFGPVSHRLQLRGRTRSSTRETERAAAWVRSALTTLLGPSPIGVRSISGHDPATRTCNTARHSATLARRTVDNTCSGHRRSRNARTPRTRTC